MNRSSSPADSSNANVTVMLRFLRSFRLAFMLALLGWFVPAAFAQGGWPERPLRIVVPYPPGGLTDVVTRVVADELGKVVGQTVIVDNRAGAGGQLGLQAVLQAPADGHTIGLVVPATMVTLPLTNPAYPIRPLEQFQPITVAVDTFMVLVVDHRLGVKTVKDFAALARARAGKLNYGTPGVGTSFHFNNVVMAQKLGFEATHIPYNGEVKILSDIAGGNLHYALASNAAKTLIDAGQVTALAVTSERRVQSMPQVPTLKEQGVDFRSDGWVGYVVPRATPAPVVSRLHAAITQVLQLPAVRQKLEEMGYRVIANTPDQFTQLVQDGTRRYGDLIKSGAVKLQ